MEQYYPMLKDAFGMFLFLGVELSVLFLLISAGVSLLQKYIPDTKIQSILSGSHGKGYLLAALLGAITPFCSCSTIPMLRGLLKAKAGFGPTLTFLFASPLLNPIILGLFVATFGLKVTINYTVVALVVSVVAAFILDKMNYEKHVIPEHEAQPFTSCCNSSASTAMHTPATTPTSACCDTKNILQPLNPLQPSKTACCTTEPESQSCAYTPQSETATSCCTTTPPLTPLQPLETACCSPQPETLACACPSTEKPKTHTTSCCASTTPFTTTMTFRQKMRLSWIEAWGQFKQVLPYLLLGISLGALIYGFVPADFIANHAGGDNLLAVPIAAIIGIPLYVRVEALIPLSAVLVGKGMGLGAVMALIIGGGGASLTELVLLKSIFRLPMMIAFLAVILGMAITAGYLFQYII